MPAAYGLNFRERFFLHAFLQAAYERVVARPAPARDTLVGQQPAGGLSQIGSVYVSHSASNPVLIARSRFTLSLIQAIVTGNIASICARFRASGFMTKIDPVLSRFPEVAITWPAATWRSTSPSTWL